MKRRTTCFLLAMVIFATAVPVLAEDFQAINILGQPTSAPIAEIPTYAPIAAYESVEEYNPMPQARYVGIAQTALSIRTEMSKEAQAVGSYREGDRVYVVDYEPEWLYVVKETNGTWITGYVLRHMVWDLVTIVDGELPYGTTPATYTAIIGKDTWMYDAPDALSTTSYLLTEGTKVAILDIQDGWAKVIYWRKYGYFYLGDVKEMTPVYDLATAQSGDTISAFISFYKMTTDEMNQNRIHNIKLACEYISIPMSPGQEFAFNSVAGPYLATRGYKKGWSYFEGQTVPSSGGGTCQVSSTMYNALLPLPSGLTIVYRRAHGPSGATYLPHGVDAAVGNETLDLVFRNDFGFTVRIEASAHGGVLYIAVIKA